MCKKKGSNFAKNKINKYKLNGSVQIYMTEINISTILRLYTNNLTI